MSSHRGRRRGPSHAPFVIVAAIFGATPATAQNWLGFARDGTEKAFAPADAAPALPDPTMTPGAADPAVGLDRICTETTRHRRLASTRLSDAVFAAYSIPPGDRYQYECDHLVPVALGGLTVAANLWPHHTSEHDRGAPGRSVSTTVTLAEATSDTLVLVRAATSGARKVWRDGYRYSKAGLVTVDLVPLASSQRALPGMDLGDREASASLMAALDACNRRFGRGAVVPGAAGVASRRDWSTKFEMRSPRYTTRLDEVPVIRAA